MRKTLLVLLVLAVATAAQAKTATMPTLFTEPYQVRGAVGDIPTTDAVEPAGSWNLEQRLTVQFDNASSQDNRTYHFALPSGTQLVNATCDCAASRFTHAPNAVIFVIEPQTDSGLRTIRVTTEQAFDSTIGFSLIKPFEFTGHDVAVVLYVPMGMAADGPVALSSPGASTDGSSTIWFAQFSAADPAPLDLWFTLHPDNAVAVGADHEGWDDNVWIFLAAGLLVGALAWAFLVSRGLVQQKARKQVAGTAAHVEAAANDPPAVLEGKKRALMAGLKELELARQAGEMPVEVYDVVKADLKKQAVTVMRALESTPADPKA